MHFQRLTYRPHGEKGQAMTKEYRLSIRCYFPGTGNYTHHMQDMPLKDIPKWVEAYKFTHPKLESITVKIYMNKEAETHEAEQ